MDAAMTNNTIPETPSEGMSGELKPTTPNPGSPEAIARGCTCPVIDNQHGHGVEFRGEVAFWVIDTCPLHGRRAVVEGPKPIIAQPDTPG